MRKIITLLFIATFMLLTYSFGADKQYKEEQLIFFRLSMSENNIEKQYDYFTAENLFDLIDGGAELYIEKGLTHGLHLSLLDQDSIKTNIMFMMMGNKKSARSLYKSQYDDVGDGKSIGKYSLSQAYYENISNGVYAVAYIDKVYLEITLTNVKTDKASEELLKNLLSKIDKLLNKN